MIALTNGVIMQLISSVTIRRFRSIREVDIDRFGNFTAFAGPNNSGKSNVLRALNAFFNNYTDVKVPVHLANDYFRHENRGRKKQLSIAVAFDLPQSFTFRKGLEATEELLGRRFRLKKRMESGHRLSSLLFE